MMYLKRKVFYLILISCLPITLWGQEFEWALYPKSIVNLNWGQSTKPSSYFSDITTNSNNNVYALLWHVGYHSLAFTNTEIELEPTTTNNGKDRKSTRLNSSHSDRSRMPSSA